MKLALIPPVELLEYTERSNMQLMLPHMLRNARYANLYGALCRDPKQYVILDNGAAEGEDTFDNEALRLIAENMGANELVVPDSLGNASETIASLDFFVEELGDTYPTELPFKLGVVAQGRGYEDALRCARIMIKAHPWIEIVYIPRLLVNGANPSVRIKLARELHQLYPTITFHLLGASSLWSSEILQAAQCKFIRSMDTSMPFVYAQQKELVTSGYALPHRGDSKDYFHRIWLDTELSFVELNVRTMLRWSRGMM